jgi:hypothetical protein
MALITSSQNTIGEMTAIMNHQETTLRHIINRDYDDINNTITTLRRENVELRRVANNATTLRRENEELRRLLNYQTPEPTQRTYLPRATVSPRMPNRELRPVSTTFNQNEHNNESIDLDRNTREASINPNVSYLPNNQRQYMRRYLTSIPDLLFGTIGEQLTPVVIRPTEQQIRQATQLVRFGTITEPQNNNCPISLERFDEQQLVTRITFCGHIFSTSELQTWFETNVRCPLCRFDIREHRNEVSRNNLSTINEEETFNNSSQINSGNYREPPTLAQEEDNNEDETFNNSSQINSGNYREPPTLAQEEDNNEDETFNNSSQINSDNYHQPPTPSQEEDNNDEIFNNLSRNVDSLLSTSREINNNLSRTILENINILRPLDNNNITTTTILDVFNDISENPLIFTNGRLFINNYLDISNNV